MLESPATDPGRAAEEKRPPHITHCLTGATSDYDWTIQASGLTFEEALSLTEALGVFIRARKQLQRAATPAEVREVDDVNDR